MVRGRHFLLVVCLAALAFGLRLSGHPQTPPAAAGQGAEGGQPVYIMLFGTVDDALHIEWTEERLQRTLAWLERYRKQYPDRRMSCLFQFSGPSSAALAERNAGTHLLDSIRDAAKRGLADIGYDGTEEPTYVVRPRPNFRQSKTAQDRWLARSQAAEWFLNEYKDPVTGEPDPARSGGLRSAREVFGNLSSIAGVSLELGGDAEIVHQIRRQPFNAIMPGLPENTAYPARLLHGYRGALVMFGKTMSPDAGSAPEVFWQDNVLRVSDSSGEPVRAVTATEGPEALQKVLAGLDRSRPHVIRVRLGYSAIYMKPDFAGGRYSSPLQYVYDIQKGARVPQEGWQPREAVDAAYAREEALIKWLFERFFPQNPGSRFVSATELLAGARSAVGSLVSGGALAMAAENLVKDWASIGNYPPTFTRAGDDYFSLADMFQMLASALAGIHRSGALPESVRLAAVYGPIDMAADDVPREGVVTVASVARVAAELADKLNSQAWKPVPENMVPARVTVDGIRLNAAQFLRLMAEAFLAPQPDTRLTVKFSYMFSVGGESFPSTRRRPDEGAVWTLKPARLVRAE